MAELKSYSETVLVPIKCVGYYRPNIPMEYHSNELYAEPSAEVKAKVKDEKSDGTEFRAALKAKKYADKQQVESLAFDDGCTDD